MLLDELLQVLNIFPFGIDEDVPVKSTAQTKRPLRRTVHELPKIGPSEQRQRRTADIDRTASCEGVEIDFLERLVLKSSRIGFEVGFKRIQFLRRMNAA